MEFYVVDSINKNIRHRVLYDDVIMCQSHKNGCSIILDNRPSIFLKNTIDSVYDFYFRRHNAFIRSSAHHIVNTKHIVSAEEKKYSAELLLILTKNNQATLRGSHDYAYFILNGEYRPKKMAAKDSDEKDAIILSDIKKVNDIVREIKLKTGEDVSSRYVVKRYKQLKIQS
jgi:hypothetical protein